jgi:hypothetical protein
MKPIGKHLSDTFPIKNALKQRDALSPLLFNFALEYVIRMVQESRMGLKWNTAADGLCQVLNLLGGNIDTVKKNKF